MIETPAPPYVYFSLLSSSPQKKNQRTETISLGEVKHLVSLLEKGGKMHYQSFLGRDVSAHFSWPPSAPRDLCSLRTAVLTSACGGLHWGFFELAHDLQVGAALQFMCFEQDCHVVVALVSWRWIDNQDRTSPANRLSWPNFSGHFCSSGTFLF